MARKFQRVFAGHVSKTVLLATFLPLSIASFFGTLFVAAFYIPVPYDWTVRTMSKLGSPRDNPGVYWLPCLGLVVSAVLALPFAGYVQIRLHGIMPRLARAAGVAFALACVLLLLTGIVPQAVQPTFGWRGMHEFLVRSSAAAFFIGMICCCVCAFRDRMGVRRSLGTTLSHYWRWITVVPIGCLMIIGTLHFLGHVANQPWAEQVRQSFRHTVLWNVAFWEWVGSVIGFTFMVISVLLLPEPIQAHAVPPVRARTEGSMTQGDEETQLLGG